MKTIHHILIFAMLHLCWLTSYGYAEMIPTDSAVQSQVQDDRQRILDLMNRQDVIDEMEKYGISNVEATARINSLTDLEVAALVEKVDRIPAGGEVAFFLVLLLYMIIVVVSYIPGVIIKSLVCPFADCEDSIFTPWWKDTAGSSASTISMGGFFDPSTNSCASRCDSGFSECIKSRGLTNKSETQCEAEKSTCFQQCDVDGPQEPYKEQEEAWD